MLPTNLFLEISIEKVTCDSDVEYCLSIFQNVRFTASATWNLFRHFHVTWQLCGNVNFTGSNANFIKTVCSQETVILVLGVRISRIIRYSRPSALMDMSTLCKMGIVSSSYFAQYLTILVTSNFSFSHSVFKKLVSPGRQKVSSCGNGLNEI